MSNKKIKVVYLAGGYPTPDNPSHGIFNQRAANAIKKYVDLTVIQYRIFKPGRKFHQIIKEDGFMRIILCVPFSPVLENKLYYFNNSMLYFFTLIYTRSILKTSDIVHASDGNLSVFASWLKSRFTFKLLVQFIGGDINQDLSRIYKKKWMQNWTRRLDAISFNSIALLNRYNELFGKHDFHKVIYRGIDTASFFPSNNNAELIIFYFLGGLPNYRTFTYNRNTKGGLNLMKAWSKLDKEIKTAKMKLLFAGPDSNIEMVRDWKAKLKEPQRVEIIGKINPADVPAFHRSGNIALIPSLEEGLPNVAMEAASTGNLIIANAVGGIPEIITNTVNGLLCETSDEVGLYKKMKWIIENPSQIKTIGKAARENMELNFSSKDFGEKYFEYYKEILKS